MDLDSGVAFNLSIGSSPCELLHRSNTQVVCRTGPAATEKPEYLVLNADGTQLRVDSIHFQYTLVFKYFLICTHFQCQSLN